MTESSSSNAVVTLERRLERATRCIKDAAVRAAVIRGLTSAGVIVGTGGALIAVAVVASRFGGVWTGWAVVLALATIVAGAAAVLAVVPAAWSQPSLDDVAERLDLATAGGNRIATALEFARAGDRSPFAVQAIADGLVAVEAHADARPTTAEIAKLPKRIFAFATTGFVLILLAVLIPSGVVRGVDGRAVGPLLSASDGVETAPSSIDPKVALSADRHEPESKSATLAGKPSGVSSGSPAAAAMASEATSGGADAAAAGGQESSSSTPPTSSAESSSAATAKVPDAASRSDSASAAALGVPGAAASDASAKVGENGGGAQAKDVPAAASDPDASHANAAGFASEAAAPSKATDAKESTGGGGSDANAAGPKQGKSAGGEGDSNGVGGDGMTSGQSQPKKSRGVAPLLLGTREAEFFEGRQLPGPDKRTTVRVPPVPSPGSPRPAVGVADRQGDENAAEGYRVPPAMRRLVGDYFHQFHSADETPRPPAP